MILGLDTSTPVCQLILVDDEQRHESSWEAGRELAKGLLGYIQAELHGQHKDWADLTGIVIFKGPGSFTGLRIGSAVGNSLAYARHVPIVGMGGDDWVTTGLARLAAGESDQIVVPDYGGEANITAPRK